MQLMSPARSQSRQTGFSLLEILIALTVLGGLLLGATTLVDQHLEKIRIQASAQQMQVFAQAVETFIEDNYAYLVTAAATGGPALQPASANRPSVLTVQTLQNTANPETGQISPTRYLPAGFQNKNSYGQTFCALVLQPKPNELYTLVVAEGGTAIKDVDLTLLAATLGAKGGAIYDKDRPLLLAKGSLGRWEFDLNTDPVGRNFLNAPSNCSAQTGLGVSVNFASGHPLIALWLSKNTTSGLLQRAEVPGQRDLNSMQTDLKFKDDFIDRTDPDAPRLWGGATIQLGIERGLGDRCDAGPTAGSRTHQHPGHSDTESTATWNLPANNPKKVPLGTLARTAQGDLLVCQHDDVRNDNFWSRPVSAGRYVFKIRNGWGIFYNGMKFVGTGYITGNNQFSGTLNCDPKTAAEGRFCGGAGNVNCINYRKTIVDPRPIDQGGGAKTAASQEQCAWYYAGGASQGFGTVTLTDYNQVDVNKINVFDVVRIY